MSHRMPVSSAALSVVMLIGLLSSAAVGEEQQHSLAKGAADIPVQNVGLSRVPKFGFTSSFGPVGGATGEYIRKVRLGSLADRMDLLAGDVILAVNGTALTTANSWYEAIQRAS